MNGEQADEAAERTYPYFSEVLHEETGSSRFLTPYPIALEEIHRRSGDETLKKQVEEYLGDDIPEYMRSSPVLYLARHVATPNFETLRFLHLLEPLALPIVISQDTKDIFTSTNMLKRYLGKMPICTRITQKGGATHELFQYKTIIDFTKAQGKPFADVETLWGEKLIDFHTRLFTQMKNGSAFITDDAAWIDRNGRGNLLEHYKRFLALFVVHGVLFEDYVIEDKEEEHFVREVLEPAFIFIEQTFGVRPLITQLTPSSVESVRFWLSYPRDVLPLLKAD